MQKKTAIDPKKNQSIAVDPRIRYGGGNLPNGGCALTAAVRVVCQRPGRILSMDREFGEPAFDQESGRRHDARVGVIVLSPSLRVLYAGRAAMEWLKLTALQVNVEGQDPLSGGLHQGVTNIARTIVEELDRRVASQNWAPFEVRCHLDERQEPMWLRGLGLPNPQGLQRSRIVLTLSRNPFST